MIQDSLQITESIPLESLNTVVYSTSKFLEKNGIYLFIPLFITIKTIVGFYENYKINKEKTNNFELYNLSNNKIKKCTYCQSEKCGCGAKDYK